MFLQVKNIILYTPDGGVAGFIEVKTEYGKTLFRLKQDIGRGLYLSLAIGGKSKVLPVRDFVTHFAADNTVDLEDEIFACLVRQSGDKVETVASGVINPNRTKPPAENKAVIEIDRALKKICSVDGNGSPNCENCPYREYFFSKKRVSKQ